MAGTIRYFISQPANVAMDIIDAGGKTVVHMSNLRMQGGWHQIRPDANSVIVNGIYFVRAQLTDTVL